MYVPSFVLLMQLDCYLAEKKHEMTELTFDFLDLFSHKNQHESREKYDKF